ncbi:unannotated protein [freshwater metagenome]|uniref:Unannotated protein n=1 Tax=freshwater metagenome TaxID=449393 RepID=A0A6J7XVS3_9ZZZZ|nr:response regulator [Actinomycetota bacterium]
MPDRRILVIDDDPFARTMLKSTLTAMGYEVVGEACSASEAISALATCSPTVALVDLDLGEGPTGIDVAHALRRRIPTIGIVMLSTYLDPRFLGSNQRELPDGSRYLVKNELSNEDLLSSALEDVLDEARESKSLLAVRRESIDLDKLTQQQIDVIRLIAAGHSNSEISKRMWLSEGGIEKIIARLIKQFDLKAGKEKNQRIAIAQLYYQMSGARSARNN